MGAPIIEEIPPARLEPDLVLAGRFRLREKLGEGAMGAVWSAEELVTGRQVALKVLKVPARDARIRFLREAWAASRARHANVVDVLDLVEAEDGTLVMVMELLCGETLGALLRREGKLGVAETCAVLLSVVEAIAAVHRAKMIHRDVKPDNIFIEHRPDGRRVVKLLDFGVAKVMGDEPAAHVPDASLTTTEGILGTPYYMAPEQIFADTEIDERIDVWSLGVTLFECVVGRRPTEAPNVGRVLRRIMLDELEPIAIAAPSLPRAVQQMTTRMLAADRSARPTLEELRRAFRPFAKRATNDYVVALQVEAGAVRRDSREARSSRRVLDEPLFRLGAGDVRWRPVDRDDPGQKIAHGFRSRGSPPPGRARSMGDAAAARTRGYGNGLRSSRAASKTEARVGSGEQRRGRGRQGGGRYRRRRGEGDASPRFRPSLPA